jgi:Fe-S cluster assembly protein SufD
MNAPQYMLDDFERFAQNKQVATTPWMDKVRHEAFESFKHQGLPTVKHEAWRYTRLQDFATQDYSLAPTTSPQGQAKALDTPSFGLTDKVLVQMLNGGLYYANQKELPDGLRILGLGDCLEQSPELLRPYLDSQSWQHESLGLLNTAFLNDVVVMHVRENVCLETPIQFDLLSEGPAYSISHPRVVIILESGSRAKILENACTLAPNTPYATNSVHQIHLGAHAQLDFVALQKEGTQSRNFRHLKASLAHDATLDLSYLDLQPTFSRSVSYVSLEGAQARVNLRGLGLVSSDGHLDHVLNIEHVSPHAHSEQCFKNVIGERAMAVFNGKVKVHKNAQKSSAFQKNANLLLSKSSQAHTRPQLEIYADDVQCSHGATCGQLDQEQLFYLRSRGLSESLAITLLTRGFSQDILQSIPWKNVRASLSQLIEKHLDSLS